MQQFGEDDTSFDTVDWTLKQMISTSLLRNHSLRSNDLTPRHVPPKSVVKSQENSSVDFLELKHLTSTITTIIRQESQISSLFSKVIVRSDIPMHIFALYNEITDLRLNVSMIQDMFQARPTQIESEIYSSSLPHFSSLTKLIFCLRAVKYVLLRLERFVIPLLSSSNSATDGEGKRRNNLFQAIAQSEELRLQIRSSRKELHTALADSGSTPWSL